jgi:hypothetical protein
MIDVSIAIYLIHTATTTHHPSQLVYSFVFSTLFVMVVEGRNVVVLDPVKRRLIEKKMKRTRGESDEEVAAAPIWKLMLTMTFVVDSTRLEDADLKACDLDLCYHRKSRQSSEPSSQSLG